MTDEQIVDTYGPMVYRLAYSYTRNAFDADDVYSETFLRYFRRPRFFQNEEHRKAWLLRVTINCAKNLWQDQSATVLLDEDVPGDGEMDGEEERLDLQEAIGHLEPLTSTAVYLFYYERQSIAQIGQALGLSENAVKSRLKRARQRLRLELSEV